MEENSHLEFQCLFNTKTSEVSKYSCAYYKGSEFRIFDSTKANPQKRITIEGSLHKYWNNGAHNFNDFRINDLNETLQDLDNKFEIKPENSILKQLELGVNLLPPISTKEILSNCIMHKTNPFKWVYTKDEGNYIQVATQRYYIKIYDKRLHYVNRGFQIDKEILRFEIKYVKMKYLNDLGIYTLKDLLNYDLINFKKVLIKEWNNIIFSDPQLLKGTKYQFMYNNQNFWTQISYAKFKYHRNNLNKIINSDPTNLKYKISKLIEEKCIELNSKKSIINPLYIPLKQDDSKLNSKGNFRRKCKITGLNISMQKENSLLLSHTGLKYYFNTDKKIFEEVKYKFLSDKWWDSDHKTQIKEIAHNIRNKMNNSLIKNKRKYQPGQYQLF